MQIIILESPVDVAKFAAQKFCDLYIKKPNTVAGLATGNSQLAFYREVVKEYQRKRVSFRHALTFNLDEYVGIDSSSSQSYRSYMNQEFFNLVDIQTKNTHLPECDIEMNLLDAGAAYERLIEVSGGIDFQMLGVGENGHIGFNEPTSSLASRTRVKTLTPSTIAANSHLFGTDESQPNLAMTMGIGTILDAAELLMIATGENKANAIRDTVEGPLTAMCPASALQMHQYAAVVIDEAAASKLSQIDYYKWVFRENQELVSGAKR